MNDYNHVQIVRGTNKDLLLVYLFVLESTCSDYNGDSKCIRSLWYVAYI